MKTHEDPIVVKADYPVGIVRLWAALTDPRQMVQWYFEEIADFSPDVGYTTEFLVELEEQPFTHVWEVIISQPPRDICYNWRYAEHPGKARVYFELDGDEHRSSLTVTMTVLEDFPEEIPEFSREAGLGGWTYFLHEALPAYLARDEEPS